MSEAQPTENITYEFQSRRASLKRVAPTHENGFAWIAERKLGQQPESFHATSFAFFMHESGAGLNLAFHARGGLADSRRRVTARLWRRASRGSAARHRLSSSPFSHSEVCCSVWNAALSEALQAARLLRAARELTPVCPACPVARRC